jgi:hypothetical protein
LGVENLVSSKYFFTSDIDLVYPPTFIEYMGLFALSDIPVRVIFSNNNLQYSDKNISTYKDCKNFYENTKEKFKKFYAPGNGLVHLPTFKKIGGYDVRFIGHGSEDSEFNYRISKLNKYFQIDLEEVNTYHLYHQYNLDVNKKNFNEKVCLNEQMWRYIIWKGETEQIPLIKAGEIEFPDNLMEKDWSLKKEFI